ncbi:MAG TPA: type II toxin-antitoxin system prevent-host-death family antitoxin [Longimicrobium sp.]|nr:type II toxin-antitoxin system prevent-host-death family antitoxin [Longimicrobium sp.]
MTRTRGCLSLVALLGLVAATPDPASATWSIVAVDPRTREVGAAGASCTPFVVGIVGLAPGRGAIVVQAMSNPLARMRGVEMLNQGATPASIVRALRDPELDPEEQQYGVAALGADSGAAYTGAEVFAASAAAHGPGVAVQGNTLPSAAVVHAAMAAYKAAADSGLPLAERLLRALEAGSAAGGDRRCGRQAAHSAFLGVARPGDEPRNPYVRLIIPDQSATGANPVHLLRRAYDRQRAQAGADLHDVVRAAVEGEAQTTRAIPPTRLSTSCPSLVYEGTTRLLDWNQPQHRGCRVTIVDVSEAETQLEKLIDEAGAGEEVVITRDGTPVARLVAPAAEIRGGRVPGSAKGMFTVPDDFDAPLEDFRDYM